MTRTTTESTLLRFCELLKRWRVGHEPDDLKTALTAIESVAYRGESDAAELMCRAISAVTGMRVTIAATDAWTARGPH